MNLHLRLKVHRIKDSTDLFTAQQANGDIVSITIATLHDEQGKFIKTADLTKDLIEYLNNVQIPVVKLQTSHVNKQNS